MVGRPVVAKHNAITAVAAAQDALARLEAKIEGLGITPKPQAEVGIVVFYSPELGGKTVRVTMEASSGVQAVAAIAAHPEPIIAGLIFAVADAENFEMWARPFLKGRLYERMLDVAVADLVERLRAKQGQGPKPLGGFHA